MCAILSELRVAGKARIPRMCKLIVVTSPDCRGHRPGPGHPESVDRLDAALEGVPRGINIIDAAPSTADDLALVHDRAFIDFVRERCEKNVVLRTDPDTVLSPGTWRASLGAVGAMRRAVAEVMQGSSQRAFCVVRPPGHHAVKAGTKGFCFFNTIAIGARILQREHGLRRIVVLDWDAHHGNGTQDEFYAEEGVFYISLHQFPLFPGSGQRVQQGVGAGLGYTLNIPMAAGACDRDMLDALRDEVEPAITAYRPQMILVSAGFDGHVKDRLAGWMLTTDGYAAMTRRVRDWSEKFCEGRIVSLLEGGYDKPALRECVECHLKVLAGIGC